MQHRVEHAPHRRKALYGALNPRFDVRNIMSRSGQTIRGKIASSKAVGPAKIESWWEAMFALRADAAEEVLWFETNPVRFAVQIAGLRSKYTPDVAVGHRVFGTCLGEVKRHDDLARPETLVRLTAIRRNVEPLGYRFLWSTDRELNHREENSRIRTVKIHRCIYTRRETETLVGQLSLYDKLTIGEATKILGRRAAVLHLLATRHYYVDYRRPLSGEAIIARNPQEANHAVALFSLW